MKLRIYLDNGANIHSKRSEEITSDDLGYTDEEWAVMDEAEKQTAVRDHWLDRIKTGFKEVEAFDPVCLVQGKRMSEHVCLHCCLCFTPLTVDECYQHPDGTRRVVCVRCMDLEALNQEGK